MRGELPDNYSMVAGDSIFIRVLDQDGKALTLANSGVSFSFDQTEKFVRTTINDTTAVLFANASGTPTLTATIPSGYSTREIIRTFNLTRDQNKPILYYQLSDTWKELPYRNYRLKGSTIYKVVFKGEDVIIFKGTQSPPLAVDINIDNKDVVEVKPIIENNQIKTFKLNFIDYGTAKVTIKLLKVPSQPEDVFKFSILRTMY